MRTRPKTRYREEGRKNVGERRNRQLLESLEPTGEMGLVVQAARGAQRERIAN